LLFSKNNYRINEYKNGNKIDQKDKGKFKRYNKGLKFPSYLKYNIKEFPDK